MSQEESFAVSYEPIVQSLIRPMTLGILFNGLGVLVLPLPPQSDIVDNVLAWLGQPQPQGLLLLQALFGFPAYGLLDSFVYGSMANMLCSTSSYDPTMSSDTLDGEPRIQPFLRTASCGSETHSR